MNELVAELKTRARLGLNAARRGDVGLIDRARAGLGRVPSPVAEWRLRHCLTLVANEAGFDGWEQARRVLGGEAVTGDDMGAFWHAPRCAGLLSHWFTGYAEASAFLAGADGRVLLPYRRQFVVADDNYLEAVGVPGDAEPWRRAGRDLVAAYGTPGWLALARHRLHATRSADVPGRRTQMIRP
ncbi:hypothetical protein [Actinoplanes teichomyceticus]|uniref:Uncharacterized protein n=1 Tax=Actinoplanes teichomyceticus TaxID=1867 RepID=A0A561VIL2_ACTTI|nr:hypothetical protein [Actinoplanes teichomyceticus]TWG11427.1 hypothetical protein FHX34_106157 [Actinoplanes teichomyceticus]GIF15759.1 hypothetical protein Ate01nite_57910 [Actinoplanes teichomyceticus]